MVDPWPFADPPETEVIVLARILSGESPLRLVTHDADDGGWQFLDGDHVFVADAVVVALGEMLQLDPSLAALAGMPPGHRATRVDGSTPWRIAPEEPDPGE